MNIKEIKTAAAMASRFIALSKEIKTTKSGECEWVDAGKESSALRRASMDLTRQLAKMRKPS